MLGREGGEVRNGAVGGGGTEGKTSDVTVGYRGRAFAFNLFLRKRANNPMIVQR